MNDPNKPSLRRRVVDANELLGQAGSIGNAVLVGCCALASIGLFTVLLAISVDGIEPSPTSCGCQAVQP